MRLMSMICIAGPTFCSSKFLPLGQRLLRLLVPVSDSRRPWRSYQGLFQESCSKRGVGSCYSWDSNPWTKTSKVSPPLSMTLSSIISRVANGVPLLPIVCSWCILDINVKQNEETPMVLEISTVRDNDRHRWLHDTIVASKQRWTLMWLWIQNWALSYKVMDSGRRWETFHHTSTWQLNSQSQLQQFNNLQQPPLNQQSICTPHWSPLLSQPLHWQQQYQQWKHDKALSVWEHTATLNVVQLTFSDLLTWTVSTVRLQISKTNVTNKCIAQTTPTDAASFNAICAADGQQAKCCAIPILGQALLCQDPVGA